MRGSCNFGLAGRLLRAPARSAWPRAGRGAGQLFALRRKPGGGAGALRPDARLRPQGFRVADRRRQGRARAWRRAGRRRLLRPRRRGQSAQPAAAGRHGRGVGRQWRAAGGAALFQARPAARRAGRRRFACDRGLAYDLLGQQAQAQADYRAALGGRDGDEARRRLALSLAISGDRDGALQTLAPLSAKGDAGVPRVRAFVLALTGDSNAAMSAINAAMPGSSARVAPFLQRLPAFPPGRRPRRSISASSRTRARRLCLSAPPSPAPSRRRQHRPPRRTSMHLLRAAPAGSEPRRSALPAPSRSPTRSPPAPTLPCQRRARGAFQPKIWLQLASGQRCRCARRTASAGSSERTPTCSTASSPMSRRSAERRAAADRSVPWRVRRRRSSPRISRRVGIDAFKCTNSQSDRIAPLADGMRLPPARRRQSRQIARPAPSRRATRSARAARHFPARPRPADPLGRASAACATRRRCSSRPTATITAFA